MTKDRIFFLYPIGLKGYRPVQYMSTDRQTYLLRIYNISLKVGQHFSSRFDISVYLNKVFSIQCKSIKRKAIFKINIISATPPVAS